jgi:amino acid adenylation domain-containing protein
MPEQSKQSSLLQKWRAKQATTPATQQIIRHGEDGLFPLSSGQESLWFLHQVQPESTGYHIPVARRLHGHLQIPYLQRSLTQLLRRHWILRTTFEEVDGQPRQRIQPASDFALTLTDGRHLVGQESEAWLAEQATRSYRQPFDLRTGPLFRGELFLLGEQDAVLVLTLHHLITDGWSNGVLLEELGQLYRGYVTGEEVALAEPNYQYVDLVAWQRQRFEDGALATDLAYWRQELEGAPARLDLPLDHRRPAVARAAGALHSFGFSRHTEAGMQEFAYQEGATSTMLLFAGFSMLLSRYTHQKDIVIGMPIFNRPRTEMDRALGLFVNTVAVRISLEEQPSFRVLLQRVRRALLRATKHQEYPFEKVVEALQPERSTGNSPLFQVMLSVGAFTDIQTEWADGVITTPYEYEIRRSSVDFDLTLEVVRHTEGTRLSLLYRTDLFEASRIARMGTHFSQLLEEALAHPDTPVGYLPLLSSAEQTQLVHDWNATRISYPDSHTLSTLFEAQVQRSPEAIALSFQGEHLSYGELNARANQLAHHLLRQHLPMETLVGLALERSLDLVIALLAVVKAGGAYLPLDPRYPSARLQALWEDAQMPWIVSRTELGEHFAGCSASLLLLDQVASQILQEPRTNPQRPIQPEQLAYVIFTSGSTGKPKGVAISHAALTNLLLSLCQTYALKAHDSLFAVTTLSFDIAALEIFSPLLVGARVVLVSREVAVNGTRLGQALDRTQATVMQATPASWRLLVAAGWQGNPSLMALCGGEALDRSLALRVLKHVGSLWNMYGPTETTIWSLFSQVQEPITDEIVSIGRPIDKTEVYILDAHWQLVPAGEPGELYLGGRGLARGYVNQAALTAERFLPHPFSSQPGERLYRTGDRARYRADGSLEFLGRVDYQIKLRGYRIELGEIEAALKAHPDVQDAVVVLHTEVPENPYLSAYLISALPLSSSSLQAFLRQRLPDYMLPSAYVLLDAFPLTPNRKVDRKALQALDRLPQEIADDLVLPRTPLETMLAAIWGEILGLNVVGIHQDFFALGGHSLMVNQYLWSIQEVFQVDIAPAAFLEHPTIAEQALSIEHIGSDRGGDLKTASLPPRPVLSPTPLSFAQERLWFLDQLMPGNDFYHIPLRATLTGRLKVAALEKSLQELVQRHEVFRTTFAMIDGQPMQIIVDQQQLALSLFDLSQIHQEAQEKEAQKIEQSFIQAPFDLRSGPLIRAMFVKLAQQEYRLLLVMHHIISDGGSLEIFRKELSTFYTAFATKQLPQLPALPAHYADFALWQRRYLQGDLLEEHLAYWRQQLAGSPHLHSLHTDKPRPAEPTFRGGSEVFLLPCSLAAQLHELSQRQRATLFMTLLTAFKILLYRYSGQADIVVGTPVANRRHHDTGNLIGFFVNTVVMRTILSPTLSFRQALERVRQVVFGAFAHQDMPFEQLVEAFQPERSLSTTPLFQILFAPQLSLEEPVYAADLEMRFQEGENGKAEFDLEIDYTETASGILFRFKYSYDLFEPTTIARMCQHLCVLLEGIIANPEHSIASLPLLPPSERQRLVTEWNSTQVLYDQKSCLHHSFEQQAERRPDTVALVFGEQALTYRMLDQRANQLAQLLSTKYAVGPEAPVCLYLPRSPEMYTSLLGILKAGAAYVPLDPTYPQERLRTILSDCQPTLILTLQALSEQLPLQDRHVLYLDTERETITAQSRESLHCPAHVDNLLYILYTSGSTGRPKGVAMPHRPLVNLISWQLQQSVCGAGSRTLQFTSLNFDVSCQELFATWSAGGVIVSLTEEQRRDPEELWRLLEIEAVERLFLPFAALQMLAEAGSGRQRASLSLKEIMTAGEQLRLTPALTDFLQLAGCSLSNQYGPSESHVVTAYTLPVGAFTLLPPIGRPVANTQIYLADQNMELVPTGIPGELSIGGENLARGYRQRPDLTAERFVPDPSGCKPGARLYRTGDLARYTADGMIEFLGRIDQQVKIRGFRIELGEIEAVLSQHPDVEQSAVVVREDLPGGRQLVGYVVTRAIRAITVEELRKHLQDQLPEYMVPVHIEILADLPLSPNGKIDRNRLQKPGQIQQKHDYAMPQTPVEICLARIWSEVLGIEQISRTAHFFALGGHSLIAIEVIAGVRKHLGVTLPLRSIFLAPTLATLGLAIEQLLQDQHAISQQKRFLHTLFEAQVLHAPDSCAVICGQRQLTYRELNSQADCLANTLRRCGVKPNMLVGIYMRRSPELIISLLGSLKAGATAALLDPTIPLTQQKAVHLTFLLTQQKNTVDFSGQVLYMDKGEGHGEPSSIRVKEQA